MRATSRYARLHLKQLVPDRMTEVSARYCLPAEGHGPRLTKPIVGFRSYLIGRIAARALQGREVDDVREEDD
jgi:hypothetical protein